MYDVIIPVYHPGKELLNIFKALEAQSLPPKNIIIIESLDEGESSHVNITPPSGINLIKRVIPSGDFDHAGSRNMAIAESHTGYFVCMTQDAVPAGPNVMRNLLAPVINKEAAVSYARQIPTKDAVLTERISRRFNYPSTPLIKTLEDEKKLGIKTYFASNACCAYSRKEFDELGGFFAPAIFNEDMVYAHGLIKRGGRISYVPAARVIHSHNYTLLNDFKRSFDLGVSQAMHPEVFFSLSSESEGSEYALYVIKTLLRMKKFHKIPGFILHAAVRLAGYKTGRFYRHIPGFLRKKLSMNPKFWK